MYSTESKNELALSTFKEAFALTTQDSYDYYLIAGEIALLENKPNSFVSIIIAFLILKSNP